MYSNGVTDGTRPTLLVPVTSNHPFVTGKGAEWSWEEDQEVRALCAREAPPCLTTSSLTTTFATVKQNNNATAGAMELSPIGR